MARVTGYPWTCIQISTVWILCLLWYRGMSRETSKRYSYDVLHNVRWLTMQASPFVWILIDKLFDSELVRKYTLFHDTRDWLPCYRVIKNPQTAPVLRQTDLFSNIPYSNIRFNEILNSFLQFFPSFYWMHFLTPSYLSCIRPNQRLLSCHPSGMLWRDIIWYICIDILLQLENKFPESKIDFILNCQTDYGVLCIHLRVDVFKKLQKLCKKRYK